ncbi:MAG: glycyl-tRNA synthetase beta chain, partial [Lentimonas sp.]
VNQIFEEYLENAESKKLDFLEISQKAIFVDKFIGNEDGAKIIKLYKRAANIVAIESKKDNKSYDGKVSLIALKTKHDKDLYKNAKQTNKLVKKSLKSNSYNESLTILSQMKPSITEFFDNVEINCDKEGLRNNRLTLLSKVKNSFDRVFDFSKVDVSN